MKALKAVEIKLKIGGKYWQATQFFTQMAFKKYEVERNRGCQYVSKVELA